jgi:hypothetical protein
MKSVCFASSIVVETGIDHRFVGFGSADIIVQLAVVVPLVVISMALAADANPEPDLLSNLTIVPDDRISLPSCPTEVSVT